MPDISATDASRNFSEILDGVEHRRETYRITRHGKTVARLEPAMPATGRAVKELLGRRAPNDDSWARELGELRALVTVEERSWRH